MFPQTLCRAKQENSLIILLCIADYGKGRIKVGSHLAQVILTPVICKTKDSFSSTGSLCLRQTTTLQHLYLSSDSRCVLKCSLEEILASWGDSSASNVSL